MATFFETSEQMVGVSGNGELFVITPDDSLRWAKELTKAGIPEEVSFSYDCRQLTATYDKGTEMEFTASIGEGEFWLPKVVCEAFCKAFASTYGCLAAI